MTGIGSIYNVEIFPPDEVPLNVDPERIPAWLRPASEPEPPPETATPAAAPLEFRHDPDYRHVTLRGREYLLTDKQAKVVKALHEAWLDGTRWVHVERLRELAKFDSAKLAHLFRRMPDWQELILSDRRGYYRQNITD